MIRKIAQRLARKKIIREILEHPVDLSELGERPSPRVMMGLIVMGISYVMGWPAIAACALLAAYFEDAWIAAIGPVSYGLSYLVFLLGAWMARAPHYINILGKYIIGEIFRKALGKKESTALTPPGS